MLCVQTLQQEIELNFKTVIASGSETFTLSVKVSDTINDVKEKIHDKTGLEPDKFHLVHSQKKLDPFFTVSAFYLKGQDTVYIVPFIKVIEF